MYFSSNSIIDYINSNQMIDYINFYRETLLSYYTNQPLEVANQPPSGKMSQQPIHTIKTPINPQSVKNNSARRAPNEEQFLSLHPIRAAGS